MSLSAFILVLAGLGACEGRLLHRLGDTGLNAQLEWDEAAVDRTEELVKREADSLTRHINKRATVYRPGSPTETHSCDTVRAVPSELRTASGILPDGLDEFYQKYTEAYGIPVIGSSLVPDEALKRACYVTRFLLADHSVVREWFYKYSGRIGIMARDEVTTDIPEHSYLSPDPWDWRARGLGGTQGNPITTGAEENVLCAPPDRYGNEDILLHELAHGVHLLGARYAISGWHDRLQEAYNSAQTSGLWENTYAMSTFKEYFAEGTQSFFDVNAEADPPNGVHNNVNTRSELETYDVTLYKLIEEVFPCKNTYLKRCETSRDEEMSQQLTMNCDQISGDTENTPTCIDNNGYCPYWAGIGECEANPNYMLVHCKLSCGVCPEEEICEDLDTRGWCPYWASVDECSKNPGYMLNNCAKSCNAC